MTFPGQPDTTGEPGDDSPTTPHPAPVATPDVTPDLTPAPAPLSETTQSAWQGWTSPDPAAEAAAPAAPAPEWSSFGIPPAAPVDSGPAGSSPGGNGRDAERRAGRGSIVIAAVLAAALAAAGTLGVVELTVPKASVTPTTAPAQLTSTSTTVPTTSGNANQPIVQIAANAGPAVVTITATSSGSGTSIGSGFIVRADGYILTNRHVIASGGSLTVQLADGRQFDGTVVGTDPQHDLAVVKVSASGLPTVTLGNSDKLQIGQLAIAIGDPLGTFAGSVTSGVISGMGRSIDVRDAQTRQPVQLSGLLQTDAAINEGNSGGPLLNAGGQVIGINTATDSTAQGIGFAVPINTAATLLSQAEAGNATTN